MTICDKCKSRLRVSDPGFSNINVAIGDIEKPVVDIGFDLCTRCAAVFQTDLEAVAAKWKGFRNTEGAA